MAAKLVFNIGIKEGSGIIIDRYIVCNVPMRTYYIARPLSTEAELVDKETETADNAAVPATASHWGNSATVKLDAGTTSARNIIFYMYENRRGVKNSITEQKNKSRTVAPTRATYLYVGGTVNGVEVIWRIFLGANNTSNFNIKRNCSYTYNITLNDAVTADTRVDIDFANTINLNEAGTANCYLASKTCAWHKFKATVRGNGTKTFAEISPTGSELPANAAISPASAELVWETGKHNGIIQHVSLTDDGYVLFKTGDMDEGNAVIAVKDGSGKVLWSWHIWKTSFDLAGLNANHVQTYVTRPRNVGEHYVPTARSLAMMDRDFGAASNVPSQDDKVAQLMAYIINLVVKIRFLLLKDGNT